MDELHKELKMQAEACYMTIKEANEKLENIRITCDHSEQYIEIVDYTWGVGHIIHNAKVCGVCGKYIQVPYSVK